MPNYADKFRAMAERAAAKAAALIAPRPDNTPKRAHQAQCARIDGYHQSRIARALRAMADWHDAGHENAAVQFSDIKTAAAVAELTATKTEHQSYYSTIDTGVYRDNSPRAMAFRAAVDAHHGAPAKSAADIQRDTIAAAVEKIRFQRIPGFFPTPPDICARIAGEVAAWVLDDCADAAFPPGVDAGPNVLEPSAGIGDLADAILAAVPAARISCVELRPAMAEICKLKGHRTYCTDFIEPDADIRDFVSRGIFGYDAVVMNPPFEKNASLLHVIRALTMVRPGGRLWAILPGNVPSLLAGPSPSNGIVGRFVETIHAMRWKCEMLPAGSFKNAFSPTGVATCLLTVGDGVE